MKEVTIVKWVDKEALCDLVYGYKVDTPEILKTFNDFDFLVIAVNNANMAYEIKMNLMELGLCESRIVWEKPEAFVPYELFDFKGNEI